MVKYPYTAVPHRLTKFLIKAKTVGVPDKVDKTWLKSVGFESSNDSSIVRVLEFIGFVDSSKAPTRSWSDYRLDDKSKAVLGAGIVAGYAALFDTHPEAHLCNDEDLTNYFKSQSKAGKQAIARTVKTFKALCSLADFGEGPVRAAENGGNGNQSSAVVDTPLVAQPPILDSPTPALHIDFQVHIAADAPPEQIDKIFESMAKHLYGKSAD